jgi:fatty-acyl-CoA synthase
MSRGTLFRLIENAPDAAPCILFEGAAISYGAFRERILRLAGGLRRHGIERGDVVAVWLPNVPDAIALHFACARIGATVLSLNLRLGKREIDDFAARTQCRAIFYVPSWRGRDYDDTLAEVPPESLRSVRLMVSLGAPARALTDRKRLSLDELADAPSDQDAAGQPGDRCLIMPSSGTTSQPKLVIHANDRVCRRVAEIARALDITSQSRLLLGVPFCGAFGYTVALTALGAHAQLTVIEQFAPEDAAIRLGDDRITHMFGTNDMLDKVLAVVPPDWTLPALRMYGHANFTPGLHDLPALAERYGVHLRGCFGQSETLALFASQPDDASIERRAQSGGLPLASTSRVRVRSLETGELLPAGEIGEIELYTTDVMLGYLGNPSATAKAFAGDGYLRTGDLGYMMDDGGFIHVSRIGDVLRLGGYLVSPLEIEEVLLDVPGVAACQVVSVEARGSTRPVAFVLAEVDYVHDEAKAIEACRSRLAVYKVPIRVFRLDAFPVTPSPNGDKVKKTELRELAMRWLKEQETTR